MSYLTVLGHTNIDVQLDIEALPVATGSRPVTGRRTVYGGTACNIARHAAGLGVPVRLWSRVGGDFPPDWKVSLEADGVDLSRFDMHGDRTPTCYIVTDARGEQAYMMDQGAMTPPYSVPVGAFDGATWLHVATGDPDSYWPAMEAARHTGVKIAFDPGQEIHFAYDAARFEKLLDASHVFFANDHEMEKALGFLRYGDPAQLLDHVDTVIHTHGAEGATLYRAGHKPVTLPASAAEVVDPTGAGDALRAGWYSGLFAGLDVEAALRRGMQAAAFVVGFQGPQSKTVRPADL